MITEQAHEQEGGRKVERRAEREGNEEDLGWKGISWKKWG